MVRLTGRALVHAALCLVLAGSAGAQREDAAPVPGPAPPVETYPVELWLQTQYGPKESTRPAPGIHVEIGIQDSSRAVEPDSRPLELQRPVLATATSDAEGELRVTVPVPVEWRKRSTFLWVRVETPGHPRFVQHFNPHVKAERERLRVWPGGTVFGRALDERGAPLAGARVSILRHEDGAFVGGHAGFRTLPDGSFAVHFYEAGLHGIHVRHDELGSSPRLELALDPARVPEPLELAIRGGPAVVGHMLDPEREPLAGAWLVAVPAGHAPRPTPAALFEAEHSGGLFGGMARTDADGHFELAALLPGRYDFHLSPLGDELAEESSTTLSAHDLGPLVASLTLAAGQADLVLVHAAHRLEVSVRAADGTPLLPRRNEKGALELPELSLQSLTDEYEWFRPSFLGERVLFAVQPGHAYLLRWQDSAFPLLERRLTIDARPYRTVLPLVLGPRGAAARLEVRVVDPSGVAFADPLLTLVSTETGRPVAQSLEPGLPPGNAVEGSVWSLTLPPGRYRVRATSDPLPGCVVVHPLPRTPFSAVERVFELGAGQHERLELRLGAAGHLDLESASGTAPGAREAQAFRSRPSVIDPEFARKRLGGATLWLVAGERRIPLEAFEVDGLPSPLDWLLPGWPARGLDPLPPGEWTLRAERADLLLGTRVLFETRVRVEAGQVTRVRW